MTEHPAVHFTVGTSRPIGSPIMTALTAEDPAAAFLELCRTALDVGEWSYEVDGGFAWIPHRSVHTLEILERPSDAGGQWVCRSTQHLVTSVDSDYASDFVNYLNQRNFGVAFFFNPGTGDVYASASVVLDPAQWWDALLFLNAITRSVGPLEVMIPMIERECRGTAIPALHPVLGERSQPDGWVLEFDAISRSPEAGTGVWFAQREIKAMRQALAKSHALAGLNDEADRVLAVGYDKDSTAATNFEMDYQLPFFDSTCEVRCWQADHPEFGMGIEILISTPIQFEDPSEDGGPPISSMGALAYTNAFNSLQHFGMPASLNTGAWSVWRSKFSWSMFIDAESVWFLQSLAGLHVGEVLALLVGATPAVLATLYEWIGEIDPSLYTLDHPGGWSGVEQNAGKHSYFCESSAVEELIRNLPINELLEPIDVTDELWSFQHSRVLCRFGIFNPVGPSIGSLEVAIDYNLGSALLLERTRHPLSPSLRLHAVIDREGYESIAVFGAGVLADLPWSPFDWFEFEEWSQEDDNTMLRGLLTFGYRHAAEGVDLGLKAAQLVACLGQPWDILERPDDLPLYPLPEEEDPVEYWAVVVSRSWNIDNYKAYLRSAWQGAIAWITGASDPEIDFSTDGIRGAQEAATRESMSVARRRSGDPDAIR